MRFVVVGVLLAVIGVALYSLLQDSPAAGISSQAATEKQADASAKESGPELEGAVVHDEADSQDTTADHEEQPEQPFEISWRPRHEVDYSGLPEDYAGLHSLAQGGDADAALMLARLLRNCEIAPPPSTAEEIAADVKLILEKGDIPTYEDGKRTVYENDERIKIDRKFIAEAYQRRADQCNGITMEQRAEKPYWLQYAFLNSGDAAARLDYATSFEGDRRNRLLKEAWLAGDGLALQHMRPVPERSDAHSELRVRTVDIIHYRLAVAILIDNWAQSRGMERPGGPDSTAESVRDLMNSRMQEHERMEAERLALELIRSNENCCFDLTERPPAGR